MDKYFQRSNDAVLADKLMRSGQKLAVWLTDSDDLTTFHLISYSDDGLFVDSVLQENLNWQSDFFSWAAYRTAEFLLPTSDPAITLRDSLENAIKEREVLKHSLTQALNEMDELKHENAHQKQQLKEFRIAVNSDNKAETIRLLQIQIKNWQAMSEGQNEMIEELQEEKSNLKHELEIFKDANRIVERIMAIMETEIESFSRDASDYKQAYNKASERIENLEMQVLGLTTDRAKLKALNDRLRGELNEIDYQDEYKQAIVLVLQRITTALGLEWHCSDYDPQDYEQRILAEIATLIGKNDQQRGIIAQNNKAFAQENERLLAVLEDRCNKIDILEDNLDRSDSDRLSELTSIMRMVQALDKTPQANLVGALYLTKRVLFETICKLDPSQAIDL